MEENNGPSVNRDTSSNSKVAGLIQKYDLGDIGEDLENHWTSTTDDRMSLRDLADFFSRELLAQELQQKETNILEGEAANYYRLLTDDDVSRGTRIQAENQLEQEGVDVEQVQSDFVSRQAIHTYLTKERKVSYGRPDHTTEERVDARINAIRRLKSRVIAVAEQAISELSQPDQLSSGKTHITVLIQVQCARCSGQYPITEYLTSGGCDCFES